MHIIRFGAACGNTSNSDWITMNTDVLRFARERKGLTQSQLAEAIDSHQSIISGIERSNQDIPVQLMFQLCDALEIHPAALFDTEAKGAGDPAYIISGRVSGFFLSRRQKQLGEILHDTLDDLIRMRVDLIALTVHLFDRRPTVYAGAILGQWGITHRQTVSDDNAYLQDTQGELFRSWRQQKQVRKPGEQCAMPDYEPAVVIDLPVAQGMVGFGFKRDLPDTSKWGRIVADAVSEGIGLLDEVGQSAAPNLAAEMVDMKARLKAIEERLSA
jgi:transcriptional regulator with XRE-family HTH domain